MSTVILGAGIIGCSIAFYLSDPETARDANPAPANSIHLVEPSPQLFASASGKAGGFVKCGDWFSPTIAPLAELSFALHKRLADQHQGRQRWGYATSTAISFIEDRNKLPGTDDGSRHDLNWMGEGVSRAFMAPGQAQGQAKTHVGPHWLAVDVDGGDKIEIVGEPDSTAQVDPERLSRFLLDECLTRGVQLHQPAQAILILRNEAGKVVGVRVQHLKDDDSTSEPTTIDIACSRIVFAAGAWTPEAFSTLFPNARVPLPVSPLAGHSVILRSPRWVTTYNASPRESNAELPCHGVFTSNIDGFSPELFSRFGGGPTSSDTLSDDRSTSSQSEHEIYLAGLNSSALPLPRVATESAPDEHAIARLTAAAHRLLGPDVDVIRTGLCFRPVTPWGYPIIARLEDALLGGDGDGGEECAFEDGGGVFVAAGHGPWGIAHSLGTGKVVAELVRGKVPSADISELGLRGV